MYNQPIFKYVLLIWDFILLTVCYLSAQSAAHPGFWTDPFDSGAFQVPLYLISVVAYLFAFLFSDLYKRNIVITRYRQAVLIVKALTKGGVVVVLFIAVFNLSFFAAEGKQFILYFAFYGLGLFTVFRALLVKPVLLYLASRQLSTRNILIVGADLAGQQAAAALTNDILGDFNVVGFLDDYKETGCAIEGGHTNKGKLAQLQEVVPQYHVDEILIAIDNAPYERLIHIVEKCLATGAVVRIYADLLNIIADKINVEFYGNIPVVMLSQQPLQGIQWKLKKIADVVLASIGLIALSPFFLLIAAGIKLSSPGPVIFTQKRIGRDGRPFDFYKFRSMHVSNDDSSHKDYVRGFIEGQKECAQKDMRIFKITDDPRIFTLGRFIRKTSLDEFPQLYNVVKGDMSLVGPRPCLAYEWECYEQWHRRRLDIPPGCTGLWQALGRSTVSFEDMVILDLYYRSNMTFWLDLKIVLQTFPVIFFGKGGF